VGGLRAAAFQKRLLMDGELPEGREEGEGSSPPLSLPAPMPGSCCAAGAVPPPPPQSLVLVPSTDPRSPAQSAGRRAMHSSAPRADAQQPAPQHSSSAPFQAQKQFTGWFSRLFKNNSFSLYDLYSSGA